MQHEKSCGAIVIKKDGEKVFLLMIKHLHGGHWAFPKGHVEGNETEEETAHREVFEETGIKIEIIPGYRKVVEYSPRFNVRKKVVYFLAKALNDELIMQEEEIKDICWKDIDSAEELTTFKNDKALISMAKEYLNK